MNAPRLSLEGIPVDIAEAISSYGTARYDFGYAAGVVDAVEYRSLGADAEERRTELVAAIKAALASAPPVALPHAQTITLGVPPLVDDTAAVQAVIDVPLETGEADALPLGEPWPRATPGVEAVLRGEQSR